jgi:hypothetical protein
MELTSLIVALNYSVFGSMVIICSAVMSSLHIGTDSFKNGKHFVRTALTYIDLLKMPPMAKETKRAKMIGRNRFTFSVVSSIMMARENERRE